RAMRTNCSICSTVVILAVWRWFQMLSSMPQRTCRPSAMAIMFNGRTLRMEVSSVSTEPPGQARTKLDRLYRGRFEASADGHPGEAGENTLAQTVRKVLYVQLP